MYRGSDRERVRESEYCVRFRFVCAALHVYRQTDKIPSSSVRNRIWMARRRADGMARWFVHFYVSYKFDVMCAPEMDKMLSLMCLQCWRLCNGIVHELPLSANSFSYGFLYTQFPVSIHTIAADTFTGMTATRRSVFLRPTSNRKCHSPFGSIVAYNWKPGIFASCVSAQFSAIVPRIADSWPEGAIHYAVYIDISAVYALW